MSLSADATCGLRAKMISAPETWFLEEGRAGNTSLNKIEVVGVQVSKRGLVSRLGNGLADRIQPPDVYPVIQMLFRGISILT